MMAKAHVTIDLRDVLKAGSVRQALLAWCEQSDDTSGGIIGPEFSTSGPGSGWSMEHTVSDFARRALDSEYGALYYLDVDDGRLATLDDEGEVQWTDESVVRIEAPDLSEALEHLPLVAQMHKAVDYYHYPASDEDRWAQLAVIADPESSEDDLIEAIRGDLREMWWTSITATRTAKWRDIAGGVWDLPTNLLIVGKRAVLWTNTDEAGVDDIAVCAAEDDRDAQVRAYAEEIASGLGELVTTGE